MFTGAITQALPSNDLRTMHDRFSPQHINTNIAFANQFAAIAQEAGCTPAQLSLAWMLAHPSGTIIPLPGSTRVSGVQESLAALKLSLSDETLAEVRQCVANGKIAGGRYNAKVRELMPVV